MPDGPESPSLRRRAYGDAVTVDPDAINAMLDEQFAGSGGRCAEVGADFAVARTTPAASSIRPGGYISGPTQFGLADAALWFLVFGAVGRIEPMALTSELSIRFVRPAIGATLWARATLAVAGRRNIVGSVQVWTDGHETKPCAVAQGTYALPLPLPQPPPGSGPPEPAAGW